MRAERRRIGSHTHQFIVVGTGCGKRLKKDVLASSVYLDLRLRRAVERVVDVCQRLTVNPDT
ncbi:hypothetical protein D3C87_1721500 [compost metagenome]